MNEQILAQKYQQFKNDWLGKRIDFDTAYGYQCVDLNRYFANKVLEITMNIVGGTAFTGWQNQSNTYPTNLWQRVENTISAVPPVGAFVHFAPTPQNSAGHIAIVDKANQDTIWFLEQNGVGGGNGLGQNAIRVNSTNYTAQKGYGKVLGWYIPKNTKPAPIIINMESQNNISQIEKIQKGIKIAEQKTGQNFGWIQSRFAVGSEEEIGVFFNVDYFQTGQRTGQLTQELANSQKEVQRLYESEKNKDQELANYKITTETLQKNKDNAWFDKDNQVKVLEAQIGGLQEDILKYKNEILAFDQNSENLKNIYQPKILELEERLRILLIEKNTWELSKTQNGELPNPNLAGVDLATGQVIFGDNAKKVLENQIDTQAKNLVKSQMPLITQLTAGLGVFGSLIVGGIVTWLGNPEAGVGTGVIVNTIFQIINANMPNKK